MSMTVFLSNANSIRKRRRSCRRKSSSTQYAQTEAARSHGKTSLKRHELNTDRTSGKMLSCGFHPCPQRCHQLQDHSKMECKVIVSFTCTNKHTTTRKCHEKTAAHCRKCEAEVRAREKKRQRDHKLDEERQAKQRAYAAQLAEIEAEIEHRKRVLRDQAEDNNRQQSLDQKKQDLRNLQGKIIRPAKQQASSSSPPTSSAKKSRNTATPQQDGTASKAAKGQSPGATANSEHTASSQSESESDWDDSKAKDEWEWQKMYEGAENEALDSLVPMIGTLACDHNECVLI